MNRCSFCEWIPILPMPVCPLAGPCLLGQNTVVGSMLCSSWLCAEACQEEKVGIPIFVTRELSRRREGNYFRPLPSEPNGKVSLHPAQASQRPVEEPVSI